MEKQLKNLAILENYQNRQVVLNYYEDEDFLWKREGFHFKSIKLENGQLDFTKVDESHFTISLKEFPEYLINSDFQNYYFLQNGPNRIELYFPS